ncbi:MAG: hypothetical protein L6Q92_13255 [Phycisphaerae bacterium]|nr:hypothetical protein [Phycisphaerae bacterium]
MDPIGPEPDSTQPEPIDIEPAIPTAEIAEELPQRLEAIERALRARFVELSPSVEAPGGAEPVGMPGSTGEAAARLGELHRLRGELESLTAELRELTILCRRATRSARTS